MMKTILNVSTLVILLTAFIVQAQGQNQSQDFPESIEPFTKFRTSSYHSQYDSTSLDSFILAKMEQYHFPGLSACIFKDDQMIWNNEYGYANIAQNKLVTESTLFHIASVSKLFTATAIMQLWENGLFELDDDINDYLPFEVRNPLYPDDPLTFRMLLTHTSSIRDNWEVYDQLYYFGEDSPIALDSFLVNYLVPGGSYYYSSNYNSWAPGSQWDYANAGAALLGYLVETITATSFENYCQDSIFVPLGMNETSWFLANMDTSKIATPYEYNGERYISNPHWGVPYYPAGQIRTNATQLARFLMAFIQKGQIDGVRILNSSTVDSMTTVQYPEINKAQGLLWRMPVFNIPDVGERIISGHLGGWRLGVNSLVGYILGTGENVGAIVLTNRREDDGIFEIGRELLSYGVLNATNIEGETSNLPAIFTLSQNYPNPFNPSTAIKFDLPKATNVRIEVYNTTGQNIRTLLNGKLAAGNHQVEFNGQNLSSGVYFYRIEAGENQDVKKMILIK